MGTGVNVRVGAGGDGDITCVDVIGEARVTLRVAVIEIAADGKVRVARYRVAVGVDVALDVAVEEGVRVALDVGVNDGTAVAVREGSGVGLGEGNGEGVPVAARVGNCTTIDAGVTG